MTARPVTSVMATLLTLLPALAAASGTLLVDDAEGGRTFRRTTASGQEVRIVIYAQWNRVCQPQIPPAVAVVTPPAHGTLAIRPADTTAGAARVGTTDCQGRIMPGTGVFYTPVPGFRGADRFEFTVQYRKSRPQDIGIVDVK